MFRALRFSALLTLPSRLRALHARRRSMAFLLARSDDRLIDDIGLTREDLHKLLSAPDPEPEDARGPRPGRPPMHRTTEAGFGELVS
ncbi:hypothetical protein [Acidimangrovimonas sediminis]|uniref:hypothetical protein n=1 Tax=Acidimangrovimonas sediminis TaxID=2056283 RepID=UPI000C7FD4B9|nr:hypothetical protein [Acidimangrovimonas sediminis]